MMGSTKIAFRAFAFVVAAPLASLSMSCGGPDCGGPPCTAPVLDASATGTIVVAQPGEPTETYSLGVDCSLMSMKYGANSFAGTSPMRIACEAKGKRVAIALLPGFDPRELHRGVETWERSSKFVAASGAPIDSGGHSYYAIGTLTVDVSEAIGGQSPYPDLVSPNYRRRFRVMSEAAAEQGSVAQVTVDVEIEQSAEDVHLEPIYGCGGCK